MLIFNSLDNCIKFDIIGAISSSQTGKLLAIVGHEASLLAKNDADSNFRRITM